MARRSRGIIGADAQAVELPQRREGVPEQIEAALRVGGGDPEIDPLDALRRSRDGEAGRSSHLALYPEKPGSRL